MFVDCEQCQTRFVMEDALIAPGGTRVQCSRCQHLFTVRPTGAKAPVHEAPPQRVLFAFGQANAPQWPAPGDQTDEPVESYRSAQGRVTFGAPAGGFASTPAATRPPAPAPRPEPVRSPYEPIWAAPDDDGPRKVLADQLVERGDPRGEFITLQLAEPEGTTGLAKGREQELRRHFLRWVPRGVDPNTAVFRRGFLHECRWSLETDVADPEWRTVEHLTCGYGAVEFYRGTLFAGPALSRLRTLIGANEHAFEALSAQRHPRLEVLQTRQVSFQQVFARLGTILGWAHLHTLDLRLTPVPTERLERLVEALLTKAGPRHALRTFSIDDAGGSIDLVSVSKALERWPSLRVEVHVEAARRCWVELEGGQARLVSLPSAPPTLRRQVTARAAEQRLQVIEVAR